MIKFEAHVCAYLDVLGGADLYRTKDVRQAEAFIDSVCEFERRLNGMRRDGTAVVRTFSDNVFAALPVAATRTVSSAQRIAFFVYELAKQIQRMFIFNGLAVRGGITVGYLYIIDRAIFGPAVVDAVELGKAKYSRVLIDESVFAATDGAIFLRAAGSSGFRDHPLVYKAVDALPSVNYLGYDWWLLAPHAKMIEQRLYEFRGNEKVRPKCEWLRSYHADMEVKVRPLVEAVSGE